MFKPRRLLLSLALSALTTAALAQSDQYTALSNSNIRAEPTTQSTVIGGLRAGEQITVTGDAAGGSWYRVELADGRTGYIFGRLLQPPPEAEDMAEPEVAEPTAAGQSPAPDDAFVYFISPFDGEIIPGGQVRIRMGLSNMGVAPAGVDRRLTGHHHLLINVAELPPLNQPIPADDNHVHFGRGQTEHLMQLPPGEHTLQLLLGDHDHVPHDPPVFSKPITIIVPES